MTERATRYEVHKVPFLGLDFNINISNPPKLVKIPPHFKRLFTGELTEEPCLERTATVHVGKVIGKQGIEHRILITCVSAQTTYPQEDKTELMVFSQCHQWTEVEV